MKNDVYTRITDQIIEALEAGDRPWMRPWDAGHAGGRVSRPLRDNGIPFAGINVIALWSSAVRHGFTAPYWMTFSQAKKLGGCVRKGEKGSLAVLPKTSTCADLVSEGREEENRYVLYMRGYRVFNAEQTEGLPDHFYAMAKPTLDPNERIEQAERYFQSTGADIKEGGNRAYYDPGDDRVQMPPFVYFKDPESYYATLAHECIHWTCHSSRCNRDFGPERWGDAGYAMEELVAELGSAFLAADLGLTPEIREDHAPYVASWLKVLKDDNRAIFAAAGHAQMAVACLDEFQPTD